MTNKFEQLLELLINEEQDKAEALFHEIVVEKSRDIYEGLADAETQTEAMHKDKKDDICFIVCLGLCCVNANGLITIFFPPLKTMFSSCSSFIFLLIVSLGINNSSAISIKFIFSI